MSEVGKKQAIVLIRKELPQDREAVFNVNRLAFGQEEEALLVDALRDAGAVAVSLVAIMNDEIAGHILFSELPITTSTSVIPAVSLAPMAVLPQ
jgi:putative acetyltransferase